MTSTSIAPAITSSPALSMPSVGTLGMIIDSDVIRSLLDSGAKIRIKNSVVKDDAGTLFGSVYAETTHALRLITSMPGKGLRPGRRLAEVSSQRVDVEGFEDAVETLRVTIYGPKRTLLSRERLFADKVNSWSEALTHLGALSSQNL